MQIDIGREVSFTEAVPDIIINNAMYEVRDKYPMPVTTERMDTGICYRGGEVVWIRWKREDLVYGRHTWLPPREFMACSSTVFGLSYHKIHTRMDSLKHSTVFSEATNFEPYLKLIGEREYPWFIAAHLRKTLSADST